MIDPDEANIVTFIFHHFMNGESLEKISNALASMDIVSPTGRTSWSRETISKLLLNGNYTKDVVLGETHVINGVQMKSYDINKQILMRSYQPTIVSHEIFLIVQ